MSGNDVRQVIVSRASRAAARGTLRRLVEPEDPTLEQAANAARQEFERVKGEVKRIDMQLTGLKTRGVQNRAHKEQLLKQRNELMFKLEDARSKSRKANAQIGSDESLHALIKCMCVEILAMSEQIDRLVVQHES